MSKILFSLVFFVCFFRISILYSNAYLALLFSGSILISFMNKSKLVACVSRAPAYIWFNMLLMFCYALILDMYSGSLFSNPSSSFSFRLIFLLLCSILPAYYIVERHLKGNIEKLLSCMVMAFTLQIILFIASYMSTDIKILLYDILGASASVNLNNDNLTARGFGFSNEINYASPFLMVLLSIYFMRGFLFKFIIFSCQLLNSNNAIVAAILSLAFSKVSIIKKGIMFISCFLLLSYFAVEYFPRFQREFSSGGSDTLQFLFDKHFFFLNEGLLEVLAGTAEYIYGGNEEYLSDIVFVIIFNFGGLLFTVLFSFFIISISINTKVSPIFSVMWLLAGIILNSKGLALGANAYMFMSFLFIFNSKYTIKNN